MADRISCGKDTFYIDGPTKTGIVRNGGLAALIDTGNGKDAARRILKHTFELDLSVSFILNTHTHSDHIGGNETICSRCGCVAYAGGVEAMIGRDPDLSARFLYGAHPPQEVLKALSCKGAPCEDAARAPLAQWGLETFPLKGHGFAMMGVRTQDEVYFIGDSLFSEETIQKYRIVLISDVCGFFNTLDWLSAQTGFFVPSHAPAGEEIGGLIECNRRALLDTLERIAEICRYSLSFDFILKRVFDTFGIMADSLQHTLVGHTVKSCLSYLLDQGVLRSYFEGNTLFYLQA